MGFPVTMQTGYGFPLLFAGTDVSGHLIRTDGRK
ncbi:hypothetical protein KSAC_33590 (plasmid) [Komagataeibacter saccharivorans]|nr:hypothetical protein KSAC_33590 [Komagataeibacter saccharivorans]